MKKFLIFIITLFICVVGYAATFNQYWYVEGNSYATTTCTTGGDITLPTPPTKYGYDFIGWELLYTPIEYLESTGTQWIDTGYKFTFGEITIDAMVYYRDPISEQRHFVGSKNVFCAGIYNTNKAFVYAPHLNTMITLQNVTGWHHFITKENDTYNNLTVDLIVAPQTQHSLGSAYSNTINILLFKGCSDDERLVAGDKIKYIKFYQDDTLVRDFIPVLDTNGTPCMYDKVTQQFFYNQGTGDFIAGPVVGFGE